MFCILETWHGDDNNAALANLRLKHMRSPFKWVFMAEQCQYLTLDSKDRPDSRRNHTVIADLGSKVRSGPSHGTDDLEPHQLHIHVPLGTCGSTINKLCGVAQTQRGVPLRDPHLATRKARQVQPDRQGEIQLTS